MTSVEKVSSMTAFAQVALQDTMGTLSGELRAVNSRFFEINLRVPEALRGMEAVIRDKMRAVCARGKIDLTIRLEVNNPSAALEINETLVQALLNTCNQLKKNTQLETSLNLLDVLRWPGAIVTSAQNQQHLEALAQTLLDKMLIAFQADRQREGQALQKIIESRVQIILDHVAEIAPLSKQILPLQREKILDRIKSLNIEIDNNRLEQELVYWAQKTDVVEEIDRLRTHLNEVLAALKKGGAIGRRLDFLAQELNREANTLGSKSLTQDITYHVIEIKILIEQIREQVQNLE